MLAVVMLVVVADCDREPTLRDEKVAKDTSKLLVSGSNLSKMMRCPEAWRGSFDECRQDLLRGAVIQEIAYVFGFRADRETIMFNANRAVDNMGISCNATAAPTTAPAPTCPPPTTAAVKAAKDVAYALLDGERNGDPDYPCPAAYKEAFGPCERKLLGEAVNARFRYIAGSRGNSDGSVALALRTIAEVCSSKPQ